MAKLEIDDIIVQDYLNGEDITTHAYNPLFNTQTPDGLESIFQVPEIDNLEEVGTLRNRLLECLIDFTFVDEEKARYYLNDYSTTFNNITIHLVVGLPNGLNRLLRITKDDHIDIIFDLINITDSIITEQQTDYVIDYVSYIISFLTLDLREIEHEDTGTLESIIFTASFAHHLAYANFTPDEDEDFNTKLMIEYLALKKIKRQINPEAEINFLSSHFASGANISDLGTTGIYFLNSFTEPQIRELFQLSPSAFCQKIIDDKKIKKEFLFYNAYLYSNVLTGILACGLIVWAIVEAIIGEYSNALKTFPMIFASYLLINQIIKYRAHYQTRRNFILYSLICLLGLVSYLLCFIFLF